MCYRAAASFWDCNPKALSVPCESCAESHQSCLSYSTSCNQGGYHTRQHFCVMCQRLCQLGHTSIAIGLILVATPFDVWNSNMWTVLGSYSWQEIMDGIQNKVRLSRRPLNLMAARNTGQHQGGSHSCKVTHLYVCLDAITCYQAGLRG